MTDTADKIAELHREIDDNLMMRDGPLLAILKILRDQQEQIEALQEQDRPVCKHGAEHEAPCLDCEIEQEQPQGEWLAHGDCSFGHGEKVVSTQVVAALLNKSGTRPDDSDELLEARARLTPEMRERGLAFAHKSRQDAARISNQYPLEASTLVLIADFLGKLLLGEGE